MGTASIPTVIDLENSNRLNWEENGEDISDCVWGVLFSITNL